MSGKRDLETSQKEILARFYLPAQRASTLFVGPLICALCLVLLLVDPCWQFATIMASGAILMALFAMSYAKAKHGDFGRSAIYSALGVAAFGIVVTLLVDGMLPIMLMACFASSIRVSLVSRRFTAFFVLGIGVFYAGISVFLHLSPYAPIALAPWKELALVSGMVFLTLVLGLQYLMQLHRINDLLFESMRTASEKSARMLEAVQRIHPVIERASTEIEEISAGFAAQASEQAAATSEINATVGEVGKLAERTAEAAAVAEAVSDGARSSLVENSRSLRGLVEDFEKAVDGIEASRADIMGLTEELDRVEIILRANREVGEQIKVLAVNASIEAAAAGEHGRGFGVVAGELRNLIRTTDENLALGNQVLRGVRERSRESTESIRSGAEALLRYYDEMRKMAELVDESAGHLLEASRNVNEIAHSAREQQTGMREVGSTMVEIDAAAGQLSGSAARLTEVIERLAAARGDLKDALSEGSVDPTVVGRRSPGEATGP